MTHIEDFDPPGGEGQKFLQRRIWAKSVQIGPKRKEFWAKKKNFGQKRRIRAKSELARRAQKRPPEKPNSSDSGPHSSRWSLVRWRGWPVPPRPNFLQTGPPVTPPKPITLCQLHSLESNSHPFETQESAPLKATHPLLRRRNPLP